MMGIGILVGAKNLWSLINIKEINIYTIEITSIIHMEQLDHQGKKFHIFINIPITIAFGLGMTFGHFLNAIIYNYNPKSETYYPTIYIPNLSNSL